VDKIPGASQETLTGICQVPGDLLHPVAVRPPHNARDLDRAGLQIDDEQHEVANQAFGGEHINAEEIRRGDRAPMRLEERLPARLFVALGSGIGPVLEKDPLDRASRDLVSQVLQRATDSSVPPTGVRPCHRQDELLDFGGRLWPPHATNSAAVILLRDQPRIPSKQRVRRYDGPDAE